MNRGVTRAGVGAIALASILSLPGPIVSVELAAVDPALAWYSATYGVSEARAAIESELADLAGTVEVALEAGEPDAFGGLYLDHEPELNLTVLVSGPTNRRVEAYLPPALATILTVRQVTYPLAALEADAAAIRSLEPIVPFDVGVNVRMNRVEVYTADRIELDEYLSDHNAALPDSTVIVDVVRQIQPATHIIVRGGLALTTCSTGFTVRNASSTKGVLTAAHCQDSQSFAGVAMVFHDDTFGGSHDEQWHRGTQFTFEPKYQIGSTAYFVTGKRSRAEQAVGAAVCKIGKSTGYDCGEIVNKSIAPGYVPNAAATFIQASTNGSADMSSGGDSGGVVEWNHLAYGIVSGEMCFITCWDLIYTPINYVESGLGVTVLTGP
jgi:hypothetical protein